MQKSTYTSIKLFYASSRNINAVTKILQDQIILAIPWFKKWKFIINPAKTKAIMFLNWSTAYKD